MRQVVSRKEPKEGMLGHRIMVTNTADVANIQENTTGTTLLYTPICINGHVFRKCLIDTGSEVNVMALRDATKYGIAFDPKCHQADYWIQWSKVPGGRYGDVRHCGGPMHKDVIKAQFIISSGHGGDPILGFPALNELGLTVNCKQRELTEQSTGLVVHCAATTRQENGRCQ